MGFCTHRARADSVVRTLPSRQTLVANMSAEALVSRLEKVKRLGAGRWQACCPAHPDRTPSLRIRELDDGRVLVKCFGQDCSFEDIVSAAGVDMEEMFPPSPPRAEGYQPERRPFFPSDVYDIARHEITVVYLIGADLNRKKEISNEDYERLSTAVERLESIAQAAYGQR